jgi:ribulose-5-phosphate 4-epimerase/fuculose-1-phosphate aldolase
MSEETKARDEICRVGASIFQRDLTFGSTGNISVRLPDGGYLMTPTNASLGALDPAKLPRFDATGRFLDGDQKPSLRSQLRPRVQTTIPSIYQILDTGVE